MKINTEQENELLEALEGIRTVLEAKRNGDDMRLTIDIQQDIEKVLQQVKLTYPTVKYPISLINGGCGSCFSNFISDMIPVYDRLKKQQANEIEGLNNQLVVDSTNATDDNKELEHITNPFNPEGYDDNEADNPNIELTQDPKTGLFKASNIEPKQEATKAPVKKAGRKPKR